MIVNQIHYHYDHETPADASVIVLQVASDEEASSGMRAIQRTSYLTPAEVPCTPEEQGPLCDRDAVLAEIGQKCGIEATSIPGLLLAQCGGSVDDYDDLDGSIGYSSCDLRAKNEGTIFVVVGHMHEPRYITWDEGTVDEMCFSGISVVPDLE